MSPRSNTVDAPAARGQMTVGQLKSIDVAVGGQVRLRRILLGMSQEVVSQSLGLTFQQLQKYEHGTNRISGSRLFQLGIILHCTVSFFFETADVEDGPEAAEESPTVAEANEIPSDLMTKRKTVELVRAFYSIGDQAQSVAALNLLKTMARAGR